MSRAPILQSDRQKFYSQDYQRYGWKLMKGLVVWALLLAGAAGAEAQDTKVYPGLMCVQHFPVLGPPESRVVLTGDNGEVLNTSPDTIAIVHCPIVRDNVVPGGLARELYQALRVVVLDHNPRPNENIDCIAVSVERAGIPPFVISEIIGFINPSTEENESEALQALRFLRPTRSNPGGTLFLRCIIPKQHEGRNSGIFSYTIEE